MTRYIIRRLLQTIPTLLGITIAAFLLVRLTGDPANLMLGPDATLDAVNAFREKFGLW
jgi:ABC-type dipeptide/oligopeptide/nickel transport system permease component